jgi:hypothetical protein
LIELPAKLQSGHADGHQAMNAAAQGIEIGSFFRTSATRIVL